MAEHEIAAGAQAGAGGQGWREPTPRGVYRQRGLVDDQRAGLQAGRHGGGGGVHGGVIRLAGRVGDQRHDDDDHVALRHAPLSCRMWR